MPNMQMLIGVQVTSQWEILLRARLTVGVSSFMKMEGVWQ
jgi:hypothetical protein